MGALLQLRTLGDFLSRSRFAAAFTGFHGKRDYNRTFGYPEVITLAMYRSMYQRDAIAARVVETFPRATWRGGGELVEDEDPQVETPFEKAWNDLNKQFQLWSTFQRADILAGLGRYSVLLIGVEGSDSLTDPLKRVRPGGLLYVKPYSEEDAQIQQYDLDANSPRYGEPLYYSLRRTSSQSNVIPNPLLPFGFQNNKTLDGSLVHYSRMVHIADGCLDDNVFGIPRLERIWNRLLDLMKVTGGGSEAYFRRADGGTQWELDPDVTVTEDDMKALDAELDEFEHGMKRNVRTRGVNVNRLGSDVADFRGPASALIDQISAGTGIPQRILMGSERGQLASTQDRSNFDERAQDRRLEFAAPRVVRPFVDLMIAIGVLPEPKQYEARWPEIDELDESQKATVAVQLSTVNKNQGETVITSDEIRDRILKLPALTDEQKKEIADKKQAEADAKQKQLDAQMAMKQKINLAPVPTDGTKKTDAVTTDGKKSSDAAPADKQPRAALVHSAALQYGTLRTAVDAAVAVGRAALDTQALRDAVTKGDTQLTAEILKASAGAVVDALREPIEQNVLEVVE